MIFEIGKNGAVPLPRNSYFSEEDKLKLGDILICKLSDDMKSFVIKKHHDQTLTDEQIKAHGYLCRVEEFNPDCFK